MITQEQINELKQFDSPTICNAIECFNLRPRSTGFLPPQIKEIIHYGEPMIGYAATGKFSTRYKCDNPISMDGYYHHVQDIGKPSISVLEDTDEVLCAALWGEVNAQIHMCLGCVGTVTNGGVRDVKEARELGFGYYASCVAVSHGYIHLTDYACPVNLFGVEIKPGELLFCDDQGIVIIPEECLPRLADACRAMADAELPVLNNTRAALAEGREIDVDDLQQWKKEMGKARNEFKV